VIVAAIAGVLVLGCEKKLTFERWQQLQGGESKSEVRSILGKPHFDRDGEMTYANRERGIAVNLWFEDQGKHLIRTEWSDPVHGIRVKGVPPGG
jgi:hypothetical protein